VAYDLVLAGGRVVDPASRHDGIADIGVADGLIVDIAPELDRGGARQVIDVTGAVVTPGLIDLHTHLFHRVSTLGVDVDEACLPYGVTTSVDAGTSGAITFPGFRKYCVEPAVARSLAFLNIASIGLILDDQEELAGMRYADREAAIATIEANRDICLGVKVRMSKKVLGDLTLEPLLMALDIAETTGTRVMVHITRSKLPVRDILRLLRSGDIVTHVLHGHPNTVIEDGALIPEVAEAQARGVIMDIGHGWGSFSRATSDIAFAAGFRPNTISTDLHTFSRMGPAFDLPTTLSKFMSLGMTLAEVIAAGSMNAASAIGREDLGSISPGCRADIAAYRLNAGSFRFEDCHGVSWLGDQMLTPMLTVLGGKPIDPNRQIGSDGEEDLRGA
jgi:dihydroorotase